MTGPDFDNEGAAAKPPTDRVVVRDLRPGDAVVGPGAEWIGMVGGFVLRKQTPTHLLVIVTLRERQAPVEIAVPIAQVLRAEPGRATLGVTRDAVLARWTRSAH